MATKQEVSKNPDEKRDVATNTNATGAIPRTIYSTPQKLFEYRKEMRRLKAHLSMLTKNRATLREKVVAEFTRNVEVNGHSDLTLFVDDFVELDNMGDEIESVSRRMIKINKRKQKLENRMQTWTEENEDEIMD